MTPPKKNLRHSQGYNLRSRLTRLRSGMRKENNHNSSNSRNSRKKANHPRTTSDQQQGACSKAYPIAQNLPSAASVSPEETSSSKNTSCSICLDTLRHREMKSIPCGHSFHKKCLDRWLLRNNVCPMCRISVPLPSSASDNLVGGRRARFARRARLYRPSRRLPADDRNIRELISLYNLVNLSTHSIVIIEIGSMM